MRGPARLGRARSARPRTASATPDRRERRAAQRRRTPRRCCSVVELLTGRSTASPARRPGPSGSSACARVVDQWLGPERDREAVLDVIADLGGLGSVAARAPWSEVEQVLEARFEWERLPLEPLEGGAVHVGALDAMAGLPFRVVAIPGLVEGGYPGVFRPDPFLLDAEREALLRASATQRSQLERPSAVSGLASASASSQAAQLALFRRSAPGPVRRGRSAVPRRPRPRRPAPDQPGPPARGPPALPPRRLAGERAPDPVLPARRRAQRAASGCRRSSSRPPPRPSPGRPLAGAELDRMWSRTIPTALPLEDAVDAGERDRLARCCGDDAAATAIAAGSPFFQQSRLASQARWSAASRATTASCSGESARATCAAARPAARRGTRSRRAGSRTYARCGFQYLLQHVLRLQPAPEPEERRRHRPARARRPLPRRGRALPARAPRPRRAAGARHRARTRTPAPRWPRKRSTGLVEGSPPRFTLLWEREKRALPRDDAGLARTRGRRRPSARRRRTSSSSFGLGVTPRRGEPHDPEPLEIDLGDGRVLRVSGRSTASTGAPKAAWCCATTRRAARRRTTAASSAAASSSRSRSTCWPRRSSSRASASMERSSTTSTADARSPSAPSSSPGRSSRRCCASS